MKRNNNTQPIFRTDIPKVKITVVGYVNLTTRKQYKTRRAFILSKVKVEAERILKASKEAVQRAKAFIQAVLNEAKIDRMKATFRRICKGYPTPAEKFAAFVQVARAILQAKQFKFSLPKAIRVAIF